MVAKHDEDATPSILTVVERSMKSGLPVQLTFGVTAAVSLVRCSQQLADICAQASDPVTTSVSAPKEVSATDLLSDARAVSAQLARWAG